MIQFSHNTSEDIVMPRGGYRKANLPVRECEFCGTEYAPYTVKQRSCSPECRKKVVAEAKERHKAKEGYAERHRAQTRASRKRDPAGRLLSSVKNRASTTLTREWVQERIDAGVCEATGLPLDFSYPHVNKQTMASGEVFWIPSIDKIDPNKGYTPDNCRLVCWLFNRAKGVASDADMVRLAKGIMETLGGE